MPGFSVDTEAVAYGIAQGLIAQETDGQYDLDTEVTRMEFLRMVLSDVYTAHSDYEGCFADIAPSPKNTSYTHLFVDVEKTEVIGTELCVGMLVGLASGYSDGTFRPDQTITTAEAAKMITKAYGIAPFLGLRQDPRIPWYEPYRYALARHGEVRFSVAAMNRPITRSQAMMMFHGLRDLRPTEGMRYEPQKARFPWNPEIEIDPALRKNDPKPTVVPSLNKRTAPMPSICTRPSKRSISAAARKGLPPPTSNCLFRRFSFQNVKAESSVEGLGASRAFTLGGHYRAKMGK
jgi:hypothetical protein